MDVSEGRDEVNNMSTDCRMKGGAILVSMKEDYEREARKFGNGKLRRGVVFLATLLVEIDDFAVWNALTKNGLEVHF